MSRGTPSSASIEVIEDEDEVGTPTASSKPTIDLNDLHDEHAADEHDTDDNLPANLPVIAPLGGKQSSTGSQHALPRGSSYNAFKSKSAASTPTGGRASSSREPSRAQTPPSASHLVGSTSNPAFNYNAIQQHGGHTPPKRSPTRSPRHLQSASRQGLTPEPQHRYTSSSSNILSQQDSTWKHLINLKSLLDAGFITSDEYEERRQQLIDDLTGTTNKNAAQSQALVSNSSQANVSRSQSRANAATGNTGTDGSKPVTSSASIVDPADSSSKIASYLNHQNAHHSGFNPHAEYDRPPAYNHTETRKQTTIATVQLSTPHEPPEDWSDISAETATKYVYDLRSATWHTTRIDVKLDTVPFSHGALRLVYHLQDLSADSREQNEISVTASSKVTADGTVSLSLNPTSYVAKISMDIRDHLNKEIYFRDVETQTLARYYAKLYNQHNPPKLISFIKASILRLEDRRGKPFCAVEQYIQGEYRKWSNNYGYVHPDERSTPDCFSHFTWEASQRRILVCDIQGIGDVFTDPQIHSVDRRGFGKGNLGMKGIDKFLSTHRCNSICRYLKLSPINPNFTDHGTLPSNEYMSFESIKVVNISQFPRIGTGQRIATTTRTVTTTMPPLLDKASRRASGDNNTVTGSKRKERLATMKKKYVDYDQIATHDYDEAQWCSGWFGPLWCSVQ